jgi:hypothetical protein
MSGRRILVTGATGETGRYASILCTLASRSAFPNTFRVPSACYGEGGWRLFSISESLHRQQASRNRRESRETGQADARRSIATRSSRYEAGNLTAR